MSDLAPYALRRSAAHSLSCAADAAREAAVLTRFDESDAKLSENTARHFVAEATRTLGMLVIDPDTLDPDTLREIGRLAGLSQFTASLEAAE